MKATASHRSFGLTRSNQAGRLSRPLAVGSQVFWLFLVTLFLSPVWAAAQGSSPRFTAEAEQTQVTVGEPFAFTITLDMGGQQLGANPTVPDWGGLALRRGPAISRQIQTSMNGIQSVVSLQWELVASRPGQYTIGPSSVNLGGQTLQTKPVTITAAAAPPPGNGGTGKGGQGNAPGITGGEPVLSAHTDDTELNQQLKGRLFLRTIVSNHQPYVGEPVVISYDLYNDHVQLGRLTEDTGEVAGALHEELYHANQLSYQGVNAGGRQYQVAPMYRVAVIPTKEGQITFNGYTMGGSVMVRGRRSRGGFDDPFFGQMGDMFNDPVFGGGVSVQIPSPPITLNVRPLPTAGQPQGFKGTVGDFTLRTQADRAQATTDDLVTLKVTVAGRGAIELATPPEVAGNANFEVVGQSAGQADKKGRPDGLEGSRTFEYVLRPRRTGKVEIPAIRYPIFNPFKEQYQTVQTQPITVTVNQGKTALPAASPTAEEARDNEPPRRQLSYIKPIQTLQARHPGRLMEQPAFWLGQALALGALVFAWRRNRRLSRLDLAQVRRKAAWSGFSRRLREIRQQTAQGLDPREIAGHVDLAARTFIADRFNLAADGLTRQEIERLLLGHAMPQTRVERLCDLIDQCAALRYAPVAPGAAGASGSDGELGRWVDELEGLIKEDLRA